MACDSVTLENLQIAAGDDRLSQHDLWMCRAYLYALAGGYATASAALAAAQTDGYDKPSERDLELMFLALVAS